MSAIFSKRMSVFLVWSIFRWEAQLTKQASEVAKDQSNENFSSHRD